MLCFFSSSGLFKSQIPLKVLMMSVDWSHRQTQSIAYVAFEDAFIYFLQAEAKIQTYKLVGP